MRERVGSVVRRKGRGKSAKATWWARVTYTDAVTGKRRDSPATSQEQDRREGLGPCAPGGSRCNWRTVAREGTHDVPRSCYLL